MTCFICGNMVNRSCHFEVRILLRKIGTSVHLNAAPLASHHGPTPQGKDADRCVSQLGQRGPFCIVFDLLRVSVATLDASGLIVDDAVRERSVARAPRCFWILGFPLHLMTRVESNTRRAERLVYSERVGRMVPSFRTPPGGTGDAGNWCLSVFHTSPKSDGRTQGRQVQRVVTLFRVNVAPHAARAQCSESWTNLPVDLVFCAFSVCANHPGLPAAVVTEPPALTRHVSRASSNTRAWSGKHSVFVHLRRIIEVLGHLFVDCVLSFSSRDLSSLWFPKMCPLIFFSPSDVPHHNSRCSCVLGFCFPGWRRIFICLSFFVGVLLRVTEAASLFGNVHAFSYF